MQLRAGLRVVASGVDEVQVGLDPRWAVRLEGLDPDEVRALQALRPGVPLPPSAPLRVAPARWRALLDVLADAALTVDTRPAAPPRAGLADAVALGLLSADGAGRARVARRGTRTVGVLGLGPTGLTVAGALAAAGVGRLLLDDALPVRSGDVGTAGYRWSDVGGGRREAAVRVVHDTAPGVVTGDDSREPDVVVLVGMDAADPLRAAPLTTAGVPHLSVVVREADVLVGPLVTPGRGPCLHCLDLHRTDVDPRWPLLLARLTSTGSQLLEVGVLAGVAGHLAAAVVLAHLDGRAAAPGATWELGLPDALPRARTWTPHPACACAPLPAPSRQRGPATRRAPLP